MPAKAPYAPAPRAKRPPVNAAPAEIVAPISLRRNKPAGPSSAASPASPAVKGKARDPTQGSTDAGPSRHTTAAGKSAKEAPTQVKTKNPPVAIFRQKPAFTAASAASAPREDKGKRGTNDGQGAPPSLLDRLGPPPAERTASAPGAQAQADERAGEQRRQDGGVWRGGSSGRGRGRGGHRGGYAGARGPKTRVSDKLLCLGDVTSWILVDNKTVPLYKPKPDGPMKMTCHIEAIEGSEFAVGFRDERPLDASAPDFLCEVVVDGVVCSADRQIIRSWKKEKQWREREVASRRAFTWRGRSESATSLRPFKFSTLALTSEQDEASPLSESAFKALGSIQLRIYRGRVGAPRTNAAAAMSAGDADGSSVGIGELRIWEESKKAAMGLSHQASLGPPQLQAPEPRSTFQFDEQRWGDGPDKLYIVMEFKYRSRLVLELEGFVEARDDSTPPIASGSNSASSTHASSASTAAAPAERRTTRATSSAKPKLKRPRSSSPDLIRARSPSSEPPAPPPPARAIKVKRENKVKGPATAQPKALGELVLVDDSSSDDAEESGGRSSRRALKVERSTPAKPSLAALSSPSSGKKGKARASAAADDNVDDADAEIARLRAELAEYKRRELEQLRRETEAARRRDEVRRVLEARKERTVQQKEQKKEKEKEKKRARDVVAADEDEDEAREVQGLLVGAGEGARNEAKKRKKAVKREGDVLVLSDGSDSE
ncbi:uncharacterized protein JCM10292_001268 [Rhodotorula paludigena]|uniref:uncharacterized protein n=1 Tax=Rhodotorula paludigena TaxID=86838 RepID=UPI0031739BDD